MCQFNTAIRSLEGAARAGDFRTLHMIEAALQLVVGLEEEAQLADMPLKDYLRLVRYAYLEASVQASRS